MLLADTLRERIAAALAASDRPLTAPQLAALLLPAGHTSGPAQTARGLRQLEAAGRAVCRGRAGSAANYWTAC